MDTQQDKTYEVWRISPKGQTIALTDENEGNARDWHASLVADEENSRTMARELGLSRPFIQYSVVEVTVTRRVVDLH